MLILKKYNGLKEVIAGVLASRGYRLARRSLIDVRYSSTDPLDALCFSSLDPPILANVPLQKLRGLCWCRPCVSSHPFVRTIADYQNQGEKLYEDSFLFKYYQSHQPRSASEFLGLDTERAPGYSSVPPSGFTMPWDCASPMQRMSLRARVENVDSKAYGKSISIENGTTLFGPISNDKGSLEMKRIISVYESIKNNGYKRSDDLDGDVVGILLSGRGGEWCVYVLRGQHRVAAAAALNIKAIPIRFIYSPVRLSDVEYWSQVREKRITIEGAVAIFDRIMLGDSLNEYMEN